MSATTAQQAAEGPGFWDIGGYKATVRRIRDGADQLDELTKMVRERMELEQKYAKSLSGWHSKWVGQVENMGVSGSAVRHAWTSILEEGHELSRAHNTVKDRLKDELINTIGVFRKSNYHHSALRGCREANDVDEDFEKAQRQWRKLHERTEAAKKAYHSACRAEKSAYIQLMNSRGDASTTTESGDKTRENYEKWREEVKRTRAHYEAAVREITAYTTVYNESMTFVFEKCQQMELKRMKFFIEMLGGLQDVLGELVKPSKVIQVHEHLRETFENTKDDRLNADLREWSQKFGAAQSLRCPAFEEYTPEMRSITNSSHAKRSNKKEADANNGGVVLTRQVVHQTELPDARPTVPLDRGPILIKPDRTSTAMSQHSALSHQSHHSAMSQHSCLSEITPSIISGRTSTIKSERAGSVISERSSITLSERTSNGTMEAITPNVTVEQRNPQAAPTRLARPARVLYDYQPVESDEISLKSGELLEVISGPDELGWCFGRKNDSEGLFPSKFVAVI